MKKTFLGQAGTIFMAVAGLMSPAFAAELLDVKPVVTGNSVAVEVTADIPMTYTYYTVPGQARAVVDIADADPEKVEPLIVVNKGAISSISVDKAVISGMTVSRLIFNLTAQSDIAVRQQPDRKKVTISFGEESSAAAVPAIAPVAAVSAPVTAPVPAPVPEPAAAPVSGVQPENDDDPLGFDEPKPAVSTRGTQTTQPKTPSYPAVSSTKLEPVVPVMQEQPIEVSSIVKGVVIGASYIDILANGRVDSFKQMKLTKPERLAIDIPGTHTVKSKSIAINKFGVSKIRIGSNPGFTRIVLDLSGSPMSLYEITSVDDGLRIMFK